jgi:hypothetical protein
MGVRGPNPGIMTSYKHRLHRKRARDTARKKKTKARAAKKSKRR